MGLVDHAMREMKRAGLYDKGADYDGMIPASVLALVSVLASQGHSGGSHGLVMDVFNRVANFKMLSPLTSDPEEWMEVATGLWQSVRCPSAFSIDGGKTSYDLDKNEGPAQAKPLDPPHV